MLTPSNVTLGETGRRVRLRHALVARITAKGCRRCRCVPRDLWCVPQKPSSAGQAEVLPCIARSLLRRLPNVLVFRFH
ncbi:hypothetical protein MRX96_018332 [Rhipicephalus microplus]